MSAPSPLDELCAPGGPLAKEAPDAKEFDELVRSGVARLKDATRTELSFDSRFDLAYNAAHALALAALRHTGYRPNRQRWVVFQSLPHTLGLGPEVWRVLARAHDVRNVSEYEGGPVDQGLLADLITACRKVEKAVRNLPPISPAQ